MTMTEAQTVKLHAIIQKALDNDWYPENRVFRSDVVPSPFEVLEWYEGHEGFIFDHNFARALWGMEEVDKYGQSLLTIRLWANQVAVKHRDRLYRVEQGRTHITLMDTPPMDFSQVYGTEPQTLVDVQRVTYKLEQMAAAIPFDTFELEPLEINGEDVLPLYKWHLREMVIQYSPLDYLLENA